LIRKYRVLLVSSSGGVLLDLLALEPWWSQHDAAWAVVRAEDTQSLLSEYRTYWIKDRTASCSLGVVLGLFDALRVVRNVRPHLIVSAGSGVAVGFFLAAKLARIPSFWLDTFNFIHVRSLSGRVCSRLAAEVLVQRQSMLEFRPEATMLGELF